MLSGPRTILLKLTMMLGLCLTLSGCGVNAVPTKDEAVTAAWAEVLNQYQRRADLVPNLVATVKGAADFERETLQAVVEARSKVAQMQIPPDILTNPGAFKQFQENQSALTSALSRLMVVVERYPQLTATQNFATLQAQLEGTENRITVARRDYILAVQSYNTEIRTLPGRIWVWLLYPDAQLKENFTVENPEALQTPPKVEFGS
ncbi:MAG: LemA family protein [Alphaproteobacteria bacterium]|nr:LemA family protein [Alphaproteobacteria bacterium]MBO6864805.1 LemA family protein [Alphaproteobacteria bacterium]MEC9265562.1 LemA family protein [Pseudomonadota bacterium]